MAMFIAHYDWSGQYHKPSHVKFDGPVLSMAGFVAEATKWDKFEGRWAYALAKKNLQIMHITDFPKVSKEWTPQERKRFLLELASIIRGTISHGVFATLQIKDYVEIVEPHVPTRTGKWDHGRFKKKRMPYLFLLHYCLRWMREHATLPPGEKIALIYEEDTTLSGALKTYTRELVTSFGWQEQYELPVNFRPKGDPHALEAADILASVAREAALKGYTKTNLGPGPLTLLSFGKVIGGHLDRQSITVIRNSLYKREVI